jgi:hypothetical protein
MLHDRDRNSRACYRRYKEAVPAESEKGNLRQLISMVPNLLAATSFGVLMLAFVHEWAFYYTVGGDYQALLTVTDYFNSAVGWLPWFALGFILMSLF